MIRACLCLLAGVYALQLTSFVPESDRIAAACLVIFVASRFGKIRELLLIVTGSLLFWLAANAVIDSRIAAEFVGDSIVTQVRIVDFPKSNGSSVSLVAEALNNPRVPRRIRVSWFEPSAEVRLGDVWQFELRLRRPRGNSNPGVFDYEAWLLRERVGAIGYVVSGRRNQLLRSGDLGRIDQLRQQVVSRITSVITDVDRAAVLAAISVGARHLITPDQWQRYALTGTSHLMAISGLHVGLAAAGGYFLVALIAAMLWRRRNQHFVSTTAAVLVAVVYALISGLAVPAQRASLMIVLVALAILWRRQPRPMNTVGTACVAIILVLPLATMAPGFKLSFAAVLVLIWLAHRYPGRPCSNNSRALRPLFAVRQLVAVQALLLFGLTPLTVLIFGRIALAAPVVNLVAVPVFSFVTVPFTLGGLLLDGLLQPLGDRALLIASSSLGVIEMLITMAARVPAADVTIPEISGAGWLYLAMPVIWVILPPGWPGRTLAWLGLIALLMYQPPRPPDSCADIDVLDVGQGLAIVVTTRRHVVLFDTGPAFRGGSSAADTVVLPFLASRGVEHIDKLVVSHADLDHSGGVADIDAAFDLADVRVGEALGVAEAVSRACVSGDGWRYDGIEFEFIHPQTDSRHDGNDASCVLMIAAGAHRVLLTGDIERPVEDELVRNGALAAVDALIVPHHGSRTSSSLPFVRALTPSLAIVSAGYGNRWGFPKNDVVERWQAAGATVHATATSGAVHMRLCEVGGVVSLTRHRALRRRIWHE